MKPINKLVSIDEALKHVKDNDRVMIGGFGLRGYPENLVSKLVDQGTKDLTIISNDLGSSDVGLGKLLSNNQIKSLIGTYYNWNPDVADSYNRGDIDVTLVPQGTMIECIRSAGVGVPAFYSPIGVGTELAKGKEVKLFGGKEYVLEEAIGAEVALIKAHKADKLGNLVYYKTARNFNPVMALAAKTVIVEVDEIVETGELDPDHIVTPHMFTDYIIQG